MLEGPVAEWRKFGSPMSGLGGPSGANYGLPRFEQSTFEARFPFGKVALADKDVPLNVTITGWNPFIPGDADNSSLPVGIIEYTFENTSGWWVSISDSATSGTSIPESDLAAPSAAATCLTSAYCNYYWINIFKFK